MRKITGAAAALLLAGTLAGCAPAELHEPDPTPTYDLLTPTTPPPGAEVDPPGPDEPEVEQPFAGRPAQVVRVVDGDTIRVQLDGAEYTVRMIGLDTPETVHPSKPVECYGPQASAEAKRLLAGATVQLVTDPTQGDPHATDPELRVDRYDRLLAYVEVDGLDYGAHLIASGLATEYTYDSAYARQAEYRAAEQAAINAGAGLHTAC